MDLVQRLCEASTNLVKIFPHDDRPVRHACRPERFRTGRGSAAADATHLRRLHCGKWSAGSAQRFAAAPAPLLDAPYLRAECCNFRLRVPIASAGVTTRAPRSVLPHGSRDGAGFAPGGGRDGAADVTRKGALSAACGGMRCIAVILHAPLFLKLRFPQVLTAERPAQLAKASSEAACAPASPAVPSKVCMACTMCCLHNLPPLPTLTAPAHADRVRSGVCAAVFDRRPARRGGRVRTRAAHALTSCRAAARTPAPCAPPHSLRCAQFSMRGDMHQR